MKTIILLLILCGSLVAEDFLPGGIFVKNAITGTRVNLVGQVLTDSSQIVIGKTYSVGDKMLEIVSADSQTTDFQLSTGLQARVLPSSEFRVDSFNQMVQNATGEAELVKSTDYLVNLALMAGEAYIISPSYASSNTMCIVQTPLANIELNGSKCLLKANQKFVIAYVIDGKIDVLTPKTNKKEEIKAGHMAFIVPFPGETSVMITSKAIDPGELLKQINTIKEVESSKESVIFAVINGKVVGIKVK